MVTSSAQSSRTAVWTSYVTFVGLGAQAGLLGLAWPHIRVEFGQPLEAVGILLFASTAGYLTSSFLSGTLAHRYGYARMFLIGAALFLAGVFAIALAPAWALLALASALAGAGSGMVDGGLNAYSANHFTARAMNWMHASFGIGVTLAPLMLTAILTFASWRLGYLVVGAYLIVVLVLYLRTQSIWGWPPEHAPAPGGPARQNALHTMKSPLVWLSVLLFFVYAGVEATPGQWTYDLFTQTRAVTEEAAGFWVSFYWFSFTLGRLAFGMAPKSWGITPVLRASMLGLIVGAVLYWLNPFNGVGGILGLGIMGFAQAPMFPYLVLNTPGVLGTARASHSIGFQVAGAGLGVATLPSLAGLLAAITAQPVTDSATGAQPNIGIVAPFILVTSVLLLLAYEALMLLARRAPQPIVAAADQTGNSVA